MNLISYKQSEEYEGLIAELVSGTIEFRKKESFLRAEFKYFVAETITTSESYKKYGKGNAGFVLKLIEDVNRSLKKEEARLSQSAVYDLLAVYEQYPNQEKAVAEITKRGLNPYNWGSFLALVGRAKEDRTDSGNNCKHCKIHCPK